MQVRTFHVVAFLMAAAPSLAVADPDNTIDCKDFTKVGARTWRQSGTDVTFDVGNVKSFSLPNKEVSPRSLSVGGADLYEVIDHKCGAQGG